MKKIIISLLILYLINYSYCFASTNKKANNNELNRLNITSNIVEIIRDKNQIIFTGNVKAVRESFVLYTDLMIVNYKENDNKKIDIVNITAKNNVKFVSEKIVATGDDGIYNPPSNIIILKNNVKATESGITVFADEFEYNTITGKTKIIGNKKQKERVTIILDDINSLQDK